MSLFNRKSFSLNQKQGLAVNPSRRSDFSHDLRKDGALSSISTDLTKSFEGVDGADDADAGNLIRETFSSLFERDPVTSSKPVDWASKALEIATSLPEFDQMKIYTERDGDMSAIGTVQLLSAVKDQIAEMRRLVVEQEQSNDEQGEGERGEDIGGSSPAPQGQGEGQGEGQGDSVTDPNGINEEDGEDGEDGQGGKPQGFQPSKEQADKVRGAMRNAMSEALQDMQALEEGLKGAGFGTDTNPQDGDRSKMIQLLQESQRLSQLLKEAGRVMRMPSARPSMSKEGGFTPCGVELSGDLSRMIGSEFVNFGVEELELGLYQRMIENRLFSVKTKGKKPLGRGPVVVCVDESGSMRGSRHDVSRALCVATVNLMAKDKRTTTVIGYNRIINNVYEFNGKYKTARKNGRAKGWGVTVSDMALDGCGGGTSFDPALRRGLEAMGSDERADLIFITDGDAGVSRSNLDRLELAKKKGLRVTTILIGGGRSVAVEAISDDVHRVADLTSELSAQIIGGARRKVAG